MDRMNHHRLMKCALPALVAAAGLWLLVGCIYIPTFGRVVGGKDASKKVGSERSKAPLRPGRSTSDDVVRVLGRPFFTESNGRALAYTWRIQHGFVSYPLCLFQGDAIYGQRTLVLRFDEGGVLRSYEVLKWDADTSPLAYKHPAVPMPPDLQRDWHEQQVRRIRAATRPAGAPSTTPATQGVVPKTSGPG